MLIVHNKLRFICMNMKKIPNALANQDSRGYSRGEILGILMMISVPFIFVFGIIDYKRKLDNAEPCVSQALEDIGAKIDLSEWSEKERSVLIRKTYRSCVGF